MQVKITVRCCLISLTWYNNNEKRTIISVDEYMEKLDPYTLLMGIENGATALKNNLAAPGKVKHRVTM